MKKNVTLLIVMLLLLILIGSFVYINYSSPKEKLIGGDKDSYGCLIGGGYSWNKTLGLCVREWELKNNDERKAVQIATAPFSFRLTLISIDPLNCIGCYNIELQRNDNSEKINISLEDWKFQPSVCTADALLCPDGTTVGRTGPNCEFICPDNNLTESQAITILKNKYLEFKNYPNDNLPPQSITTEKSSDGWYVAFVQEGSGRPIISAKCFLVRNDRNITQIGEFKPEINDTTFKISPRTCK